MAEDSLEINLNGSLVKIPYELKPADHIVVFSHGFGVRRDSRGMFTDVVAGLPEGIGYLLFDYNRLDADYVYVRDYTEQVQILDHMIRLVRSMSKSVSLVGHSMGSITVSLLAETNVKSVILLAPPVSNRKSAVAKWEAYIGAEWREDNLYVPRRDNTITVFPRKFFEQIPTVNPLQAIISYANIHPLIVVEALEEDVLVGVENYRKLDDIADIDLIKIPGNHNFDGQDRPKLLETIVELIC